MGFALLNPSNAPSTQVRSSSSAPLGAPLFGKPGKIFLPALESSHLRTRGALRIHREEERPDDDAGNAGRHVLHGLHALFVRQLRNLDVVCLNLGSQHRAVAALVVRLNGRYRLGIAAGAGSRSSAVATATTFKTRIRSFPQPLVVPRR